VPLRLKQITSGLSALRSDRPRGFRTWLRTITLNKWRERLSSVAREKRRLGSAATPATGHLLGADFLIPSNNFHESCWRFHAEIRRSSSPGDVTCHLLPPCQLFIDRTPGP
jgi:hypothetical protein